MLKGFSRSESLKMPMWEVSELVKYVAEKNKRQSGTPVAKFMTESQKEKIRNYKEKYGNGK